MLALVLNICLLVQLFLFNFFWVYPNQPKWPTFVVTIVFLALVMFNPFDIMMRSARIEILKIIKDCSLSPFTPVKFRTFFMCDVITSSRIMLNDASAMICFYQSGEFRSQIPLKCMYVTNLNYFWSILPYWWRFWQSIHRWHENPAFNHQKYNAIKYFLSIMVGVWVIVYKELDGGQYKMGTMQWNPFFFAFFFTQLASTIYSWVWDCYMDWGLWRTKAQGKFGLRDELTYPKWFYYFAIV